MLSAQQINSFHMVATCCLANVGTQLANMEKICDPSYKCLEEKAEFIRMLLSEIQGFIPEGEEILPVFLVNGINGLIGSSIQLTINGTPIMNVYNFTGDGYVDSYGVADALNDYGSGFTLSYTNGSYYLTAPVGSGDQYSNAIVDANVTGVFVFNSGNMTYGVDEVVSNCIINDDVMIIIRRLATLLNICSPLNSLPETVYITNPCGCN